MNRHFGLNQKMMKMHLISLLPPISYYYCYFYAIMLYIILPWVISRLIKALWNGFRLTAEIPPGNRGLPMIGETLQFMAAINSNEGFYDFVRIRRLRYGNCFKTKLFGEDHVFVSSTEWAKRILNNDLGKFGKKYIRSIGELVGDQSVLCAHQQNHKFIRSRLTHLQSLHSISSFVIQFDQLILKTLATWTQKPTILVLREALKITSKAMCKILMSLEDEDELEMLQKDVDHVCEAMLAFPLKLPYTRFHQGLKARKRIMSRLDRIINERRHLQETHYEDLLQHLLTKENDEALSLTDEQIKDNILTMIIAGQDTTASAITWMIKYLDENQGVLNTLRAEQLAVAERISPNSFITLEVLNDMPYASKVVKESLRMASVVPWFPRLALHDCEIEGYKIKKGWNINVDARSVHLDPNVYDDPDKFIPSRFDDESKPYSFLAFGIGGRTCLGMNLARSMMLIFVHRLVITYRWRVMNSDSSIEKWAIFSRLKSGCPIQIVPLEKRDTDSTYKQRTEKWKQQI
ncbi:hypothetical protein LguiA_006785 [Lonicera macranthoides]